MPKHLYWIAELQLCTELESQKCFLFDRTCVQDASVQQAGGQEGLVFTRPDLGAHQLRAGCQDTGVLLVEVDARHGRHVVDVVVISEDEHRGQRSEVGGRRKHRDTLDGRTDEPVNSTTSVWFLRQILLICFCFFLKDVVLGTFT